VFNSKGKGCHPQLYVEGNVVPRCTPCHDLEHGGNGRIPFIGAASHALPKERRALYKRERINKKRRLQYNSLKIGETNA